jgi:hypothetical protein
MKHVLMTVLGGFLVSCAASNRPPPRTSVGAFVAIYRWRIRTGCEERFRAAWREETLVFRDIWGSYGTQLSRSEDGTWVAMAYWPSRPGWEKAHRQPLLPPGPEAILNDCILAKEEELHLQVTDDLTRPPAG